MGIIFYILMIGFKCIFISCFFPFSIINIFQVLSCFIPMISFLFIKKIIQIGFGSILSYCLIPIILIPIILILFICIEQVSFMIFIIFSCLLFCFAFSCFFRYYWSLFKIFSSRFLYRLFLCL